MDFHSLLAANAGTTGQLVFGIIAHDGGVLNLQVLPLDNTKIVTIYWGDGTRDTIPVYGATASHLYAENRNYNVMIDCPSGITKLSAASSTVNIVLSNERWSKHPYLSELNIGDCASSLVMFATLPQSLTTMRFSFTGDAEALLPLKSIPPNVTDMTATFRLCYKATLPFTNMPDSVIYATNTFAYCENAKTVITKLPYSLREGDGMFYKCGKMGINIKQFPPNVTTIKNTFADSSAVINLDEVVSNAPNGGFAALTAIDGAFYNAVGVSGSRSNFLRACPNLQTSDNAFVGTSTTE